MEARLKEAKTDKEKVKLLDDFTVGSSSVDLARIGRYLRLLTGDPTDIIEDRETFDFDQILDAEVEVLDHEDESE